ncbi:hypothetical protein [Chryseobacterium sp.]|uniref:hypothetical protein n=1 Tax=Chryseobacterium sp. TaxID=1871047 RepID=UPI0025C60E63|nr:hypothetical protein [Chryseobacterium sp.]
MKKYIILTTLLSSVLLYCQDYYSVKSNQQALISDYFNKNSKNKIKFLKRNNLYEIKKMHHNRFYKYINNNKSNEIRHKGIINYYK